MHTRLASLLLSATLATPLALGTMSVAAAPVAAVGNSCVNHAWISHPQTLEFGAKGEIDCSPGTTELHITVHLQVCTLDIFGCKTWADYSSGTTWNDYSVCSAHNNLTVLSGPWHYGWVGYSGHRWKVRVEGWYQDNGTWVGVSAVESPEITN